MLKLSSPYLPLATDPPRKGSPGVVLRWVSPYQAAPGLKVDVLAKYATGSGSLGMTISTTNPDAVGRYFQVETGMNLYTIQSLTWSGGRIRPIEDPLTAGIGDVWAGDTTLDILVPDSGIAGQVLALNATGKFVLPFYDEFYNYTISLPAGFTVTGVEVASLMFKMATGTPQTGEFKQTGASLKLYGSAYSYRPEPFSDLYLTGLQSLTVPTDPKLAIAVFDLLESGISIVDSMDYAGLNFIPSQNAYDPISGDFFWDRPRLTIFAEMRYAGSLQPVSRNREYKKTVGAIAYYGVN